MRHLDIGQRQKAPNFSAFLWSPHGCLITIGQHFVTTRVVHLPKRTETSLITESDQSRANHQLLQLCTVLTAWSDSDQAVRAVHGLNLFSVTVKCPNTKNNNCACQKVYWLLIWLKININFATFRTKAEVSDNVFEFKMSFFKIGACI